MRRLTRITIAQMSAIPRRITHVVDGDYGGVFLFAALGERMRLHFDVDDACFVCAGASCSRCIADKEAEEFLLLPGLPYYVKRDNAVRRYAFPIHGLPKEFVACLEELVGSWNPVALMHERGSTYTILVDDSAEVFSAERLADIGGAARWWYEEAMTLGEVVHARDILKEMSVRRHAGSPEVVFAVIDGG